METNCTLLLAGSDLTPPIEELKKLIESKDENDKVSALKKIIIGMLNGEQLDELLMHIIRYASTSNHHMLKKLLMIYWECVEKRTADGALQPTMILVCNALRNDLQHPNEYIRGCTLRLCTKLRVSEILEPLITPIIENLEHRHAFVRRNAVLAVFSIFKSFPKLIPNGAEVVSNMLKKESDISAKRNAFLMLFHCDRPRAVEYMQSVLDQVPSMGDGFQLVVLELFRKLCFLQPQEKSKYIKCIITLMETASDAVLFECAHTLVVVSHAPTAIRAAVTCYSKLLKSQSDNNVKLVILERLSELKKKHKAVLQEFVMEILFTIQTPSLDIQKKTINLVLEIVPERNVGEMLTTFKKELQKTNAIENEKERQALVHAVHKCGIRFFDNHLSFAVNTLMDLVGDESSVVALDVLAFARDVAANFPQYRTEIIQKLQQNLDEVNSSDVYRSVLWVLGQYSLSKEEITTTLLAIKQNIGTLPLPISENGTSAVDDKVSSTSNTSNPTATTTSASPVVMADGTYQTQSAATTRSAPIAKLSLRKLLLSGDHHLATAIAISLVKLYLQFSKIETEPSTQLNKTKAECLLIITSILRVGTSPSSQNPIDKNSINRLSLCLRVIDKPTPSSIALFTDECLKASQKVSVVNDESSNVSGEDKKEKDEASATQQIDQCITFRQLKSSQTIMSQLDIEDQEFSDVYRAVGRKEESNIQEFSQKFQRTISLSGFSDPIYAEAFVRNNQFDVVLDISLTNNTKDVLKNVLVEITPFGELQLCEQPAELTLEPGVPQLIKTSAKLSSAETSILFGTITYTLGSESQKIDLNQIRVDILDYIQPSYLSLRQFRKLWESCEWENKTTVETKITDMRRFLDCVAEFCHCTCLTPLYALEGNCVFLSANLCSKTVFNEDALLNVSLEKTRESKVTGVIKIRSQTRGVALGLGDKILAQQQHFA
eukprot:c19104_g1_i1.p1 GENE.c19104_g1_i1~~c19104_g1_i1.p1  ORF type:complete len:945 (-),score=413.74 c19104_g1_i1:191-3025(-)